MTSKYAIRELRELIDKTLAHDMIRAIQKEAFHAGATQNGELTVDKERLNHIWRSFCGKNKPLSLQKK